MESYSVGNRLLEYGYLRSGWDQPQVNLGLIMGKSMRPLFYDVYPARISDVKTLLNILAIPKRFGLTAVILVLDRGFYTIYNIREVIKFSFIMPLPFRTTATRDILKACRKVKTENARMYNNSLIYVDSGSFHLDGISLNYTFYYDQEREMLKKRKFFEKLTKVEDDLAKITDMTKVEETAGSFMKYLRIQLGMIITRRLSTMGRTILISNAKLAWDEALDLYRSRERVEKGFRDMKSDLGSLPMGMHSDETMQDIFLSSSFRSSWNQI
jgi:transposase